MKQKMKKGFTLVEIMIVVAIIAILAAVAIPNFVRYRKTSQATACVSNLKQIQAACEQYLLAGNSAGEDGTIAISALVGDDKWIKKEPLCPTSNANTYSYQNGEPKCSNDSESDEKAYRHALNVPATAGS